MAAHQRRRCFVSLHVALAPVSSTMSDLQLDALELEHAVYVQACACPVAYPLFIQRALELLRSGCLQNLRRPSSTDPKSQSLSCEHLASYVHLLSLPSVELFGHLPCQNTCTNNRKLREDSETLLRDLSSLDFADIPDAGTRCSKCMSSDITFDFLQTRSADEGTTVYCTCTACGKRWKM